MKYSELREKVERGARFSIDFKKRTLKINGKEVKDIASIAPTDYENNKEHGLTILDCIHDEYETYKCSVPSERSEHKCRNYFKAKKCEDLTDADMVYGERREVARFDLEYGILHAIVTGHLKWQEEWGSWFYQDPKDKDFVILREWVEPQQEK